MLKSWILESVLGGNTREASTVAALSLDERCSRVYDAVRARFSSKTDGPDATYAYPVATYDDYVIFRKSTPGAKASLFSIDFEFADDGSVELKGEPTPVVVKYAPAKESLLETLIGETGKERELLRLDAEILGPVQEAEGAAPTGREWDVILIREGMSKNRNRYTRKVLAEAAPLYEGRPMFVDHKLETGPYGRSGNDVVGFSKDVRAVLLTEGDGKEAKSTPILALTARAGIIDKAFAEKLVAAHQLGNPGLFGLSHDVRAESVTATQEDGPFYDVTQIRRVESTDWVLTPAAGGRVLRLVASDAPNQQLQEDARMLKALIESLKAAGVNVPENCDEATASRLLSEALAARTAATPAVPATTTQEATRTPAPAASGDNAALLARLEALETSNKEGARAVASLTLERSLLECSLPDVFKERIRKRFTARIEKGEFPTDATIAEAIKESVEDVGALREANVVMPHVGMPRVQVVKDRADKIAERMADFWDPSKPLQSFREMYVDITGDTKVTGKLTEDVRRRLSEAMPVREALNSTSFDQILGDSITRRMLKDYADAGLATWRGTISEVVPLSDFRTVRRMRFGGYGNLSTVAQGQPYLGMTSPTDEEVTYAPAKRGGTESITIEMIKNDDVGVIRRIPSKLARAAAQTLHEFVWDFLANNSNVYDATALAAAGHNNIVTTALSAANISSLRLKIKQQTDMSNGKRLGLAARYLIVPSELEELAFQLTTSDRVLGSNNNDPNFVRKLNLSTIVVEYWTDTNNYWVTASIDQAPMVEIGFLDGQETPELFVQDLPSQGSMFSNDQLTYKIRHIYGGAVQDFRPFAGAIVP
jgi:hypothetical protein